MDGEWAGQDIRAGALLRDMGELGHCHQRSPVRTPALLATTSFDLLQSR